MRYRAGFLSALFFCLFSGLLNNVYATQGADASGMVSGKVTEVINVTGYTYVEVDTGKKKVWAAGPVTQLKAGDVVSFSAAMPMENFHSKSMKRDFSVLYFVNRFSNDKDEPLARVDSSPHGDIKQQMLAGPVEGISKIKGGQDIAEIHAGKKKFAGKTVRVRGKVSKFTAEVMGKNWLHIRDSSTADDLTVTTKDVAAVGDTVVVEGKLELDKDYSYGYIYPVIVEDARVSKE